jgi:hypothetical protein
MSVLLRKRPSRAAFGKYGTFHRIHKCVAYGHAMEPAEDIRYSQQYKLKKNSLCARFFR